MPHTETFSCESIEVTWFLDRMSEPNTEEADRHGVAHERLLFATEEEVQP